MVTNIYDDTLDARICFFKNIKNQSRMPINILIFLFISFYRYQKYKARRTPEQKKADVARSVLTKRKSREIATFTKVAE